MVIGVSAGNRAIEQPAGAGEINTLAARRYISVLWGNSARAKDGESHNINYAEVLACLIVIIALCGGHSTKHTHTLYDKISYCFARPEWFGSARCGLC